MSRAFYDKTYNYYVVVRSIYIKLSCWISVIRLLYSDILCVKFLQNIYLIKMKAFYLLGFVVVAYLAVANSAPFFDDEIQKLIESFKVDCTKKFNCPSGTTSCSKNVSTTADRALITTEIKCLSSDGLALPNSGGVTSEQNYNPNGIHSSYEYYGSYSGGSNTVHTTNYGSSNPTNTNIETFDI